MYTGEHMMRTYYKNH